MGLRSRAPDWDESGIAIARFHDVDRIEILPLEDRRGSIMPCSHEQSDVGGVLTVVIKRLLCPSDLGSSCDVLACSEVSDIEGKGTARYLHS